MNNSSSSLISYCSWAKKKKSDIESLLESHFVGLLSIIESILYLESLLEMLLQIYIDLGLVELFQPHYSKGT